MRGARLVLAVVLVVGSASLASAECAWVFWEEIKDKHIPRGKLAKLITEWTLHDAFSTQEECKVAKQRVWTLQAELYDKSKEFGEHIEKIGKAPGSYLSISGRTKDGGYMIFQRTYLCLPDTIDPREKK